MTDVETIELEGRKLDLQLDHDAGTWIPVEPGAVERIQEDVFPLFAVSRGSRYELFSDGTFAEAKH